MSNPLPCLEPDYCGTGYANTLCANCAGAVRAPLASSKPPMFPRVDDSMLRTIRKLPELVALVRELAESPAYLVDAGRLATAQRLIAFIDSGDLNGGDG